MINSSASTETVYKVNDIFPFAREKFERIGIRPLPRERKLVFEDQFPSTPFHMRGEAAERIYSWSDDLL